MVGVGPLIRRGRRDRSLATRGRETPLRLVGDALAARVALAFFSVVSVFAVAHRVPVAVYGIYATAVAFTTLLGTFTDLGSSAVVIREGTATADRSSIAATYLQVRLGLIVVTCLGGALAVPFVFPHDARAAALLSLLSIVFSGPTLISPLGQLYGSMRSFRQSAIVQGFSTLLATLAVLWIWGAPGAVLLVGANVVGGAVGTIWAARVTRSRTGHVFRTIDWARAGAMVKSISALGLAAIVTTAYAKIDGILLLNMKGSHAAGLYAAAVRLLDQSSMVPIAIMTPISPLIATQIRALGRLREDLDRGLKRLELAAGGGLALVIIGTAYWVTLALLGRKFGPSAHLLCILAVSQSWVVLAYVATAKIVHGRLERSYVYVTVAGLVINVGVNVIVIPSFGPYGAAYATIVTELVTVCAYNAVGSRFSAVSRWSSLGLLVAAVGAACAATLWTFHQGPAARDSTSVALIILGLASCLIAMRGVIGLLGSGPAAPTPATEIDSQ